MLGGKPDGSRRAPNRRPLREAVTIEENFRDTKDPRYGLGLSATHISTPERRDRLLLIGALGQALITLRGAAGESLGVEPYLKANTVKRRTHSLFRQGLHYYNCIPAMEDARLLPLMERFNDPVGAQRVCVEILVFCSDGQPPRTFSAGDHLRA